MEPLSEFEMHYRTEGDGEPLVLLHGFSGSGNDWVHLGPDLGAGFRKIIPDLRGHGRSENPAAEWTHRQAALDVFALLDRLQIDKFKALGISGGANTLLHMATQQPHRVAAMVMVSSTPYFPEQARAVMRQYSEEMLPQQERDRLRRDHVRGEPQIEAIFCHVRGFATSYDDLNFTPPLLATIRARTLIIYGDRDFLYPVELALEMYRAIPLSQLWVVPNGSHGPVFGEHRDTFVREAMKFLRA
jgi:pimeloyl-ACP methyl ester carboxylesterase